MGRTLRSPRLRRILIAYTVNRLGNWLGLVALSLAVFDHTHSALSVAALLFAWQALPAFVVPAVVARIEASKRRSGLSRVYFFEALVTAGLAALVWHFSAGRPSPRGTRRDGGARGERASARGGRAGRAR